MHVSYQCDHLNTVDCVEAVVVDSYVLAETNMAGVLTMWTNLGKC